jgi:hypothetical protein
MAVIQQNSNLVFPFKALKKIEKYAFVPARLSERMKMEYGVSILTKLFL